MPRERSYINFSRDKAVHDKKMAGDFIISPTLLVSRLCRLDKGSSLVIHGAFCDQPWPGNEAGDDPGLSRTVGMGDTRRARLIPSACPMFCFVGLSLQLIRELVFRYFA